MDKQLQLGRIQILSPKSRMNGRQQRTFCHTLTKTVLSQKIEIL